MIETRLPQLDELDYEIDLTKITRSLWSQRLFIAGVTGALTIAAIVASLMLPKVYTTEATILPMTSSDASLAAGLAAQLGPMAGMLGNIGSGKTADLVEILSSRSMAERVTAKCHLDRELRGWKTHGELVDKVRELVNIDGPSLKEKTISITVDAAKAELSAEIANTYVSELKIMLDEIGYNSASKNRKFIEWQLTKNKDDLTSAENNLAEFQSKNHLTSLPDTIVSSIKSVSDLEAQNIGSEIQMATNNEVIGAIKSRVDALQADPNSLVELEIKRKGLASQQKALEAAKERFLDKLSALPPKAMELARLQRDVQVQNAVYLALTQQYESAVISENKESDAFLPLDKADVPDKASKPKKVPIVLGGFLLGLAISVLTVLFKDYLARQKEAKV